MKLFEFSKTGKNPTTAAMLSFFFIGLGQVYNGEIAKAVIFLTLYILSTFLTLFLIGFATTPILWLWSMIDAYRSSRKMIRVGTPEQSATNAPPSDMVMNILLRDLEKA